MQIPDCYEAFQQDEARQEAWDMHLAKLPTCVICGKKIHNGQEVYESAGKSVCAYCFDDLAENVGIVEAW